MGAPHSEELVAEVVAAAASGPRARDRAAERIAGILMDQREVPDISLASADADDPVVTCADRYWRLRFLDEPTAHTAFECARWINGHVAPQARTEIEQRWALGYGFITRDNVESTAELDAAAVSLAANTDAEDLAWFAAVAHAGRLRANFAFDPLWEFLHNSPLAQAAGRRREEPVMIALRAFAAFGAAATTIDTACSLLHEAWDRADASLHVVDVCLNGLAAAPGFPGQGELLVDLATQALRAAPGHHLFHSRLAQGLHLCDRHGEALESIDKALALLPANGTRTSHALLQSQYLGLRTDIVYAAIRPTPPDPPRPPEPPRLPAAGRLPGPLWVGFVPVIAAAVFATGAVPIAVTGELRMTDRLILLTGVGGGLLVFAVLTIAVLRTVLPTADRP